MVKCLRTFDPEIVRASLKDTSSQIDLFKQPEVSEPPEELSISQRILLKRQVPEAEKLRRRQKRMRKQENNYNIQEYQNLKTKSPIPLYDDRRLDMLKTSECRSWAKEFNRTYRLSNFMTVANSPKPANNLKVKATVNGHTVEFTPPKENIKRIAHY